MARYTSLLFLLLAYALHAQFGAQRIIAGYTYWLSSLKCADLDGDNDQDLVVVSETGRLTWFRNNGSGQFSVIDAQSIPLTSPRDAGIADLDSDGDLDLLGYDDISNQVRWFANNGTGEFGPPQLAVSAISYAKDINTVDLDGDGDMDVVATTGSNVHSSLNNGGGTFAAAQVVYTTGSTATAVADVTGDGYPDLLLGDLLHPNNGAGVFGDPVPAFIPGGDLLQLGAVDVDSDGDADLVSLTMDPHEIRWYPNDGTGTFGTGSLIVVNYPYNSSDATMLLRDLDLDGDLDALSNGQENNNLFWCENLGGGVFSPAITITEYNGAGSYAYNQVGVADLDNDGSLDVVATSHQMSSLGWFANDGSMGFSAQQMIMEAPPSDEVAKGDLDGDGDGDLVAGYRLGWFENLGVSGFGIRQAVIDTLGGFSNARIADVDDDGANDVIYRNSSLGILWSPNDGTGNFEPAQFIVDGEPFELADLDGDGDDDLVLMPWNEVEWLQNQGGGLFDPPQVLITGVNNTGSMQLADLNGDGTIDVLLTLSVGNELRWYANDGQAEFTLQQTIDLEAGRIQVSDIDEDGDTDVITSGSLSTVDWCENDGTGQLSGPHFIMDWASTSQQRFEFLDFDQDGDQDVFMAHHDDDFIGLSINYGTGVFAWPEILPFPVDGPVWVGSADLDNDGDADLITSSIEDSKLAWYKNYYNSPYSIGGALFHDENGDGTRQADEAGLPWLPVHCDPPLTTPYTDTAGTYSFNLDSGWYTVSLPLPSPVWELSTAPPQYTVHLTTQSPTASDIDFGLHAAVDTSIIELSITVGTAMCGGPLPVWINFVNTGTRMEQGIIALQLDPLLPYSGASQPPDSTVAGTIYWSFDSLAVFGSGNIQLLVVNADASHIGEVLTHNASLITIDTFGTITGTFAAESNMVLACAYDPNDKQVVPAGSGTMGAIDIATDQLEYTVRFQNTGTAMAQGVIVHDELPPQVDPATLQILGASHTLTDVAIDASAEVSFVFADINLPDSGADPLGSQGFVRFSIALNEGLVDGTVIQNSAAIHFDNNAPVITNSTHTLLVDCSLFQADIAETGPFVLSTAEGLAHQWYLDGEAIPGATGPIWSATADGDYTVLVTGVTGCTALSDPYAIIGSGMADIGAMRMTMRPNPVTDRCEITFSEPVGTGAVLVLTDVTGRTQRNILGNGTRMITIERGVLSAGVYHARLIDHGQYGPGLHLVLR